MSDYSISTAFVIATAPREMTAIGGRMPPEGITVVSGSDGWVVRASTGTPQNPPRSMPS